MRIYLLCIFVATLMGHRHRTYSSQIPEMDHTQIWNHPDSDPRLHSENGFHGIPVNVAVTGMNRMPHFSTGLRVMDYPSSSSSVELPNYRAACSETSHDFHLHTPSTASSSQFQPNYLHGPSCYNHLTTGDESSSTNPNMGGEAAFKRKRHAMLPVFNGGQAHGCFNTPSSSNLPISCYHLEQKPMLGPQCWPWGPMNMVPNYRIDNLSAAGERFQRSVRIRHSHAIHFENSSAAYEQDNLPHHASLGRNTSSPRTLVQLSNILPSLASDRRILSSGTGPSGHEINRSLAGNSVSRDIMKINGVFCDNMIQNTTPSAPMMTPSVSGPLAQGTGSGCSNYGHRTPLYRAALNYPTGGFASTILGNGMPSGVEAVASSRQYRPVSIVEHRRERNSRGRNYYGRPQFLSNEENGNSRWAPESSPMIDQSTFYDSMDLFDQHSDMRLDIDNMSYEELLALEERIGNVSTGLSEETVSRCLIETSYSSNWVQDDQEKDKCAICMEEYKDGERLSRMKCGHDFHDSCIRKWLLIKNICPICKAAALSDISKEKQIVSS